MSKSKAVFYVLLGVSCQFALSSIWIGFVGGFIAWHLDGTDLTWNVAQYIVYYGANAILCLFLGILAGFDVKKRFYAPIVMVVCLLPTLLLFRYYTAFWDWFCIATTLIVGIVAMVVSAVISKKKAEKVSLATTNGLIGAQS